MAAFGTGLVNAQPAVVDAPVQAPPTDTVSSLNFSPAPNSNLLVATSWSNQVQCWDTAIQGNTCASQPKAETKHDLPLDSSWFHDGSKVATCGCDKTVKVWDLQSNQQVQIGQHDAPVKAVCVLDPQIGGGNIVASGAPHATPAAPPARPARTPATRITCAAQAAGTRSYATGTCARSSRWARWRWRRK